MNNEAERLAKLDETCAALLGATSEIAPLLRGMSAEIERKDALLREALRALKYHSDQTRPIERTFDVMDKIKEELK